MKDRPMTVVVKTPHKFKWEVYYISCKDCDEALTDGGRKDSFYDPSYWKSYSGHEGHTIGLVREVREATEIFIEGHMVCAKISS